jgi:hypothetical protein
MKQYIVAVKGFGIWSFKKRKSAAEFMRDMEKQGHATATSEIND